MSAPDRLRALLRQAEAEVRAQVTIPPILHLQHRVRRRKVARSAAAGVGVVLTVAALFLAPRVRGPERVPLAVSPPPVPTPTGDPAEPPSISGTSRDEARRPESTPVQALPRLQVQPLAVTAHLTEAEVAAHIVVRTSGFGSIRVTVQFAYPTGRFAYATEEETFTVTGTGRNEFVEVVGMSLARA
ncbi:MAG: hypothetical protein HOW71_07010, partial [Nonomuraea sp.]|nr:hypothetical protein [Nonomuraea sp.]